MLNNGLIMLAILTVLNLFGWLILGQPAAVPFSDGWWSAWFPVLLVALLVLGGGLMRSWRARTATAGAGAGPCQENPAYMRRMTVAAILYIAAVVASHFLLRLNDHILWHAAVAILPLLPCILMYRAIRLMVADMDELQYRIFMEACLFSLALVTGLCLTLGMLQLYAVLPLFSWFWVFAAIFVLFGVGQALATRRYR